MAAAASVNPTSMPEEVAAFIRSKDDAVIRDIIAQMDAIGRKYYSGGGSGYIPYEVSDPDALTLVRKQFGIHRDKDMMHEELPSMIGHSGLLVRAKLPETIEILDPIEVFQTIKAVKPTTYTVATSRRVPDTPIYPTKAEAMAVAAAMGPNYASDYYADRTITGFAIEKRVDVPVMESKGLQDSGPLISKAGRVAAESAGYYVIDIAPGDHAERNDPAVVYLRIRVPPPPKGARSTTRARTKTRARSKSRERSKSKERSISRVKTTGGAGAGAAATDHTGGMRRRRHTRRR